ncbi:MAG TPA: DUF4124 domain-containing protein [Oxalobacteraceae bacterium]|nr:DUF4124 domain-containing protein [Oxalobacteraceae bacterium]HCN90493.1 DUF4124 domain-containing protein [Oxalobacteraceae bacterium]
MKRRLLVTVLLATAAVYAYAQMGDVYLCMNENGVKEYKNTGITKGCKKVDLPGITMIPAPKRPLQTASARQAASPSDFPRIDGGTQKARDSDRKQILQDEMKTEEEKLADLKKAFNNGEPERQGGERNYAKYQDRVASMKEDLDRTEKNVEALKREIGNTR